VTDVADDRLILHLDQVVVVDQLVVVVDQPMTP
jgi:hypothetical protein